MRMRRFHCLRRLLLLASLFAAILLLERHLMQLPPNLHQPIVTLHVTASDIGQPMKFAPKSAAETDDKRPLFPDLTDFRDVNTSLVGLQSCQKTQAHPAPKHKATPRHFRPSMTSEERLVTLFTLQTFIRALESKGLTYFLYGGSLLGSFRHHGFVPWDDDVDVMLNGSQKAEVRQTLSSVPGFRLSAPAHFQWKFYPVWTRPLANRNFRWPYVDIFFFAENATHVWDELPAWPDFVFPKRDVFPLSYRPFEGARLAAPRRPGSVLGTNYQVTLCSPSSYCHKREAMLPRARSLACSQLRPLLPFVSRRSDGPGTVMETLAVGTSVLQQLPLADPD